MPKLYTTTQIAKRYGIKAAQLNQLLVRELVIYKAQDGYRLKRHQEKRGLEILVHHNFIRSDGTPDSRATLKWTETGKSFLEDIIEQHGFAMLGEDRHERKMETD